ncbi:MAG: YfiR family protein [Candidatus Methylomirabilis sp.]|nr:YfiR family protein [Deltaproteobacteria bacterium]
MCLVAALACAWTTPAAAEEPPTREYRVKAGFIVNFLHFVTWPPEAFEDGPDAGFAICIQGEDPFGSAFDAAVGKRVQGRSLTVRTIAESADPAGCHVLFVSTTDEDRMRAMLARARGKHALTVSDAEDFVDAGGMVQFVDEWDALRREKKVRFEVNVTAARADGLAMRSKLLRLATNVRGEWSEPGE